jgi:hypothetical protein
VAGSATLSRVGGHEQAPEAKQVPPELVHSPDAIVNPFVWHCDKQNEFVK